MNSTIHAITRRRVFGLLGVAVLSGVSAAVLSQEPLNSAPAGGLADDSATGRAVDPHVVDPTLDDGPEPGRLTPEMAARVDGAVRAAGEAGIALVVTSGWRSSDYQQQLFDDAVARHGTAELARQWVLPPGESMHVRGLAVDVGPPPAAAWLAENGWRFGLCRRYTNEPWHFEPTTEPGGTCPTPQPDASG